MLTTYTEQCEKHLYNAKKCLTNLKKDNRKFFEIFGVSGEINSVEYKNKFVIVRHDNGVATIPESIWNASDPLSAAVQFYSRTKLRG